MGFEQDDVSKRDLDAKSLGDVEECPGREECVVESCEFVISRRYCFRETISKRFLAMSGNLTRADAMSEKTIPSFSSAPCTSVRTI